MCYFKAKSIKEGGLSFFDCNWLCIKGRWYFVILILGSEIDMTRSVQNVDSTVKSEVYTIWCQDLKDRSWTFYVQQ